MTRKCPSQCHCHDDSGVAIANLFRSNYIHQNQTTGICEAIQCSLT
jgi:hypothetical protein